MHRIALRTAPARVTGFDSIKRVNSRFLWYYGSKAIYPDDQPAMLAAIRRMKAVGPQEDDVAALTNAAENCRQNGADCILIGCTEFSLIANEVETDLPVIDTINMLVARILAFSNLRPRELGSEPAT